MVLSMWVIPTYMLAGVFGQLMSEQVFFCLLVFLASGMSPGWVGCQLINTDLVPRCVYLLFLSFQHPSPFLSETFSHSLSTYLKEGSTLA